MKTKEAASIKKQTVTVKDLKTKKNPKGGETIRYNFFEAWPCASKGGAGGTKSGGGAK